MKKKDLPLGVDLSGKVAVITGAGGVICSTLAKAVAAAGAKVSDGKAMLVYQAIEGEKLLTGVKADTLEVFERAFAKLDGKF